MKRRTVVFADRAALPLMPTKVILTALVGTLLVTTSAGAQDRLVGLRALSGGVVFEQVSFGDDGLLQGSSAGLDSMRVQRATQLTVPMSASIPIGQAWTMDLTTVYALGEITYTAPGGGAEQTAALSGISDVRFRASGRFLEDALIITAGINAPTGRTELDLEQRTALRVLAAPALGMGSVPVGAGPSGTLGLLTAHQVGDWALAAGVAYEYRGNYQPVAALAAGAPSADFRPGSVVRVSAGVDGLVGQHRLSVTAMGDVYQPDVLRAGRPVANVRLGPVLGGDVQLQVAAPRLRDFLVWSAARYRSNFSRDGFTVENTNGMYFEGGARTGIPVGLRTDIVLGLDGRYHTGLAIDEGLPTSGVTSGTMTLGLSQRVGGLSVQPFMRGSLGRVQARGDARDSQRANFTGLAGGLVIVSRF